jgi:pantoate kinase
MTSDYSSTWGVPAHITGLFQIIQNDDPLQMGSRGAGFSIENLVLTRVTCKETPDKKPVITYNGKIIDGSVSLEVALKFEKYWKDKGLIIEHESQLPIQGGFGTSGAGALGTVFAINELYQINKTQIELGQIAHVAEVNCRTGLGDVISQLQGKAEIRLKPGAPGIGIISNLNWPQNQQVLSVFLGTLSTKDVITNQEQIKKINQTAEEMLQKLENNPTLDLFLTLSYDFATKSKLIFGRMKELVELVRKEGFKSSMVMLGESVFVVDVKEQLDQCQKLIQKYHPKAKMWINPLAEIGPRIIKKKL